MTKPRKQRFDNDVFVSYNRKDASFANLLVSALERCGLKVFQDVSGLKAFDKLDASLKNSIATSKTLLAIISPSYLQSYWCLFEALEAIQGQDVSQRFLPIVIRYKPEDQTLDENFVLAALKDIDSQMMEFEEKIVSLKAYDLSPKLEKLQFLRSHLPRVFRQIHERIYPEFNAWNEASTRTALLQVVQRLAPNSAHELKAFEFALEQRDAIPTVVPRLNPLPTILWKTRVGCQAWKNRPVVVGNDVFVGSAGTTWNESDAEDGIYCIKAETGEHRWFFPATADCNYVHVSMGFVIAGCDDGTVIALSALDGALRWRRRLEGAIVGEPVDLMTRSYVQVNSASARLGPRHTILIATYPGTLYTLHIQTGETIQELAVGGRVIGSPAISRRDGGDYILVPTIEGNLMFFWHDDDGHMSAQGGTSIRYADKHAQEGASDYAAPGYSVSQLASTPVFCGDLVIQGIVRSTYYDEPPLIALRGPSQDVAWVASWPAQAEIQSFGNLRGRPVVVGDEVLFATAYDDSIVALALDTGEVRWRLPLGRTMYEQWSSPVAVGSTVYLARHDGYLHKVNTESRKREWSMYLGSADGAGMAISSEQRSADFDWPAAWSAPGSAPIMATPTIDRGRLYVGTHEGFLYALGNL